MPNEIENVGVTYVRKKLTELGHIISDSHDKTFDLMVDGKYAEVKTKGKPYKGLDFLSFTDKQFEKIQTEDFTIFLVCNVNDAPNFEFYQFNSRDLRDILHKRYSSYEYSKTVIDAINTKKFINETNKN